MLPATPLIWQEWLTGRRRLPQFICGPIALPDLHRYLRPNEPGGSATTAAAAAALGQVFGGGQPGNHVGGSERLAEHMPLDLVAAKPAQDGELAFALDPFGDHPQPGATACWD
jgi:hypothetical protein